MGATAGSTGIRPRPSESANSRQPSQFVTHDPSGTRSLRDATTWPTAPPLITSPTWNGGRYDLTSFIRGRIDGSTDMNALRISTSPSAGSGTSTSTRAKSVGCGTPCGRAARWISRLVAIGSDPRGMEPSEHTDRHNAAMESLRGQLLVAGPDLLDPNFRRSVLLVGEHGDEGAMGVILNRPSPVSVADAVPPLADLVDDTDLVHVGGPVQPQAIVVLGDFRDPDEAAALVLGSIGFLPAEIESAADVGSLDRARVFAGYAGWGPGQLESEIAEESWIIEQALPEDVFTEDPDDLWSAVLRRKGGAFAVLAQMPPDPSSN